MASTRHFRAKDPPPYRTIAWRLSICLIPLLYLPAALALCTQELVCVTVVSSAPGHPSNCHFHLFSRHFWKVVPPCLLPRHMGSDDVVWYLSLWIFRYFRILLTYFFIYWYVYIMGNAIKLHYSLYFE